jgi:PAS domain S-box-containing protein
MAKQEIGNYVITMDPEIQKLKEQLLEKDKQVKLEIEKRKAAEKELNKNKERYKQVIQEMPVIVFATDNDGSIIFYNREFERVSGYTQIDMVNNTELLDLLFPNISENFSSNSENKNEWGFMHKNGTQKVVVWSNLSDYCPIPGWESWKVGIDITPLKDAQDKIKILSGSLPICASCKKIRDEEGAWNQIEMYITDRSEANFSHGICPECAEELYPELAHDFK